jgi:5-methylthioadenosine/S-adenosylhomocysteine deaminase
VSSRTLIQGGCVLTLGARTPNFSEADVLIEDGRVAEIGPRIRARDANVVDASDTIVMPGFVDTHRHVSTSLFRNLGERGTGAEYDLQPDDVYAATFVGLLGAVEAGITTVVDHADIRHDSTYTEAALQAHADAGLRTVLLHAAPDAAGDPISPMTTIAYGSNEPARGNLDRIVEDWMRARDQGLRIHAHVGSDESHRGVIADLAAQLDEDVTLVHCTNLDEADLDAIASSRALVALTPSSEMASGLGAPPIQELIDRGTRPGLGVDSELLAPGDLFAPMRAVISIQHATLFDLKLAGKAGVPKLLTTRDVIRYATSDGARVAGLGDVAGSLESGKQADIVVLRADRPNIAPINDPIGAVVWGMDTSNVDWVFSGGRVLMRNGVLEADVAHARELAMGAQQRVTGAAGIVAGAAAAGGDG